jgi:hypothetical protein
MRAQAAAVGRLRAAESRPGSEWIRDGTCFKLPTPETIGWPSGAPTANERARPLPLPGLPACHRRICRQLQATTPFPKRPEEWPSVFCRPDARLLEGTRRKTPTKLLPTGSSDPAASSAIRSRRASPSKNFEAQGGVTSAHARAASSIHLVCFNHCIQSVLAGDVPASCRPSTRPCKAPLEVESSRGSSVQCCVCQAPPLRPRGSPTLTVLY